jgi:hypothetical protein
MWQNVPWVAGQLPSRHCMTSCHMARPGSLSGVSGATSLQMALDCFWSLACLSGEDDNFIKFALPRYLAEVSVFERNVALILGFRSCGHPDRMDEIAS